MAPGLDFEVDEILNQQVGRGARLEGITWEEAFNMLLELCRQVYKEEEQAAEREGRKARLRS